MSIRLTLLLMLAIPYSLSAQKGITYVSTDPNKSNYDIYYMPDVDNPVVVARLTNDPGIDNHPDIFWDTVDVTQSKIVWSSDRTGYFQIYWGYLSDPEGTLQLISNASEKFSHRHPHWSSDGNRIVFDAKANLVTIDTTKNSECSVPVPVTTTRRFEALFVYDARTAQTVQYYIADADISNSPKVWKAKGELKTWIGHPSFSPDGQRILFSAAQDMDGTDWEVYSVAFDATTNAISDLKQHTMGTVYPLNINPIQMSAGAHYSHDGKSILYTSTRTPLGNSLLFRIPSGAEKEIVHPENQLTFHNANDYVPEEMDDGRIIVTSDMGPSICDPTDTEGPSKDLDLEITDENGENRKNLTDDDPDTQNDKDEMGLIGDEVSWFCGLKPNLSPCTYYPKFWNICFFRFWMDIIDSSKIIDTIKYKTLWDKRDKYKQSFANYKEILGADSTITLQRLSEDLYHNSKDCDSFQFAPKNIIVPNFFGRWDENVPLPPRLIIPDNKRIIQVTPFRFDWSDVQGGTMKYTFQISKDPSFRSPEISESLQQSELHQSTDALQQDSPYYWRAGATDQANNTTWSTVWSFVVQDPVGIKDEPAISTTFTVSQNFPNPFEDQTRIRYTMHQRGGVTLILYNLIGTELQRINEGELGEGSHVIKVDATDLPAGCYFYRLVVNNESVVRCMTIEH